MSERSGAMTPSKQTDEMPSDPYAELAEERAHWPRDDDELLLLDEIEETPDDEYIDDLV